LPRLNVEDVPDVVVEVQLSPLHGV
jgi:hypothetical protein